jgi:hypothetical protein
MNKVERLFVDKALIRGGVYLFSKYNALKLIDECRKAKISILGIDGFFITETSTQPSLENSLDFTSSTYKGNRDNVFDEARKFIEDRKNDLYFEVVCSE